MKVSLEGRTALVDGPGVGQVGALAFATASGLVHHWPRAAGRRRHDRALG
ncbi:MULTISPECIES: hypothetical protein [Hydrocarboniphaga]|jgi:hypothetical protein|uniref:Uncharacterized protein n=1 Tax=Hydrocarboniphaga effusa AP103 TaxID=1172194 RepID=I8TAK5_9GAMM|nr:hypothetical protein [Hydrocarboniphaga sp.]EIT70750.1 hypothetical protein WQQ_08870 [Hydrocarboniphaga effusa AP103]MDZ4079875.1 hypothetical protein [Hydrocarboniphaga sp.]